MELNEPKEIVTEDSSTAVSHYSTPPSAHSNMEKLGEKLGEKLEEAKAEQDQNAKGQDDDDEIQYPGIITKIAVGIGLALAIFLVFRHLSEELT